MSEPKSSAPAKIIDENDENDENNEDNEDNEDNDDENEEENDGEEIDSQISELNPEPKHSEVNNMRKPLKVNTMTNYFKNLKKLVFKHKIECIVMLIILMCILYYFRGNIINFRKKVSLNTESS